MNKWCVDSKDVILMIQNILTIFLEYARMFTRSQDNLNSKYPKWKGCKLSS